MKVNTTSVKTMTVRQLRNECYDVLSAGYRKESKFYNDDCDTLWKNLLTKNRKQLEEICQRWRAINNISEAEMRRNCQFEGIGF